MTADLSFICYYYCFLLFLHQDAGVSCGEVEGGAGQLALPCVAGSMAAAGAASGAGGAGAGVGESPALPQSVSIASVLRCLAVVAKDVRPRGA